MGKIAVIHLVKIVLFPLRGTAPMAGIIFAICISVGLPIFAFLYASIKKRYLAFFLGAMAFIVSQVMIRLPILQYLQENSISFTMLRITKPVLFAVVIGFSAGIFEGLARFMMMRYFMKQRDWQSGFLFGAGHGGIEAILFVGLNAIVLLFSPLAEAYGFGFFLSGIERFFAMLLHIGLSILVLYGIVRQNFLYVVLAIIFHGFVDSLVGLLPLLIPAEMVTLALETSLATIAMIVFGYSIYIKRKGVLQ